MANFTNNTWGLAFNETFDVFGSTANGEHSVYVAIPRPYYQGVSGLTGDGKKKIDGHYAMQANTQKIRQVDVQGGFTAAAGHNFYTARAFPEEYWNRIAFVNEPTGHVVHRAIIERQGSGFAEKDGWNIAASDDEWFAPVHAEVGPDGALWFLDFYDFIIQHNPTPIGPIAQGIRFRTAAATPTTRRCANTIAAASTGSCGRTRSRTRRCRSASSRPLELVQALRHDNMFWRTTAQRLLVERGKTDVAPADHRHRQRPHGRHDRAQFPRRPRAVDAARPRRARRQQRAGARRGDARALTPGRRRAQGGAVGAADDAAVDRGGCSSAGALTDKDLNVRLNALLALSRMPASVEAGREIYRASKDKEVIEDEWLPEAVWIAATRHQEGFLKAYADEVGARRGDAHRGSRCARRAGRGVDWSAPSLADADWKSSRPRRSGARPPSAITSARSGSAGRSTCRRTPPASQRRSGWGSSTTPMSPTSTAFASAPPSTSRNLPRQYSIPAGVLTAGSNVIAVRISNVNGRGGFVPDPAPAPGVSPLAKGSGADRHGHRRRRLHHPPRRRLAREGRGDVAGRTPP